jgi:hypothetical protein
VDPAEWTAILASYGRARVWAGVGFGPTRPPRLAFVSSRNPTHLTSLAAFEVPAWYLAAVALTATVVDVAAVTSRLEHMSPTRWWALVLLAPVVLALTLVLAGA